MTKFSRHSMVYYENRKLLTHQRLSRWSPEPLCPSGVLCDLPPRFRRASAGGGKSGITGARAGGGIAFATGGTTGGRAALEFGDWVAAAQPGQV